LVRALITEIAVDIDEAAGEIVLVIHWKGGQHSGCAYAGRELASASSIGPAGPRAIGCEGAGVCAMLSQRRQENMLDYRWRNELRTAAVGFVAPAHMASRRLGACDLSPE
jgi:hypothetical protein